MGLVPRLCSLGFQLGYVTSMPAMPHPNRMCTIHPDGPWTPRIRRMCLRIAHRHLIGAVFYEVYILLHGLSWFWWDWAILNVVIASDVGDPRSSEWCWLHLNVVIASECSDSHSWERFTMVARSCILSDMSRHHEFLLAEWLKQLPESHANDPIPLAHLDRRYMQGLAKEEKRQTMWKQ